MFENRISPPGRFVVSSVMLVAMGLLWTEPLVAQHQHVNATKKATALVEIPKGSGKLFSTAFCVSDSGIFVTNAHVVKQVGLKGKVTLVLGIGESAQAKITATVIRMDEKKDLALLRASKTRTYSYLKLGNTRSLVETARVTAFGFPFGKILSVSKDQYPNISVNVGRVTSLRKQSGKIERIQSRPPAEPVA